MKIASVYRGFRALERFGGLTREFWAVFAKNSLRGVQVVVGKRVSGTRVVAEGLACALAEW